MPIPTADDMRPAELPTRDLQREAVEFQRPPKPKERLYPARQTKLPHLRGKPVTKATKDRKRAFGKCRVCGRSRHVSRLEWGHAAHPRCRTCGGLLDRVWGRARSRKRNKRRKRSTRGDTATVR